MTLPAARAQGTGRLRRRRDRVPQLLGRAAFRRYWTAQTISYLGDQVTFIALPLTAIAVLHADAAQVGVLGAATSLPNLVLAMPSGCSSTARHGGGG